MKHMRVIYSSVALLVLLVANGCAVDSQGLGVTYGLPYCFVEELASEPIAERIGRIAPIDIDHVLLFPLVTQGVINGKPVEVGIGSPVLYKPGTDVETLNFKGVDRWPVKRYIVWVRGYYMDQISRVFLYSDNVLGRKCFLVELTPVKPGTDRMKMENAIISELKKGEFISEKEVSIGDDLNYASLVKASSLKSWVTDPLSGYRRDIVLWGAPERKVTVVLTDDDFRLIESYLRGDKEKLTEIGAVRK